MLGLSRVRLLSVILLASPITVLSLPDDREQAINIQADSAEQHILNGKEQTIYTGGVVMVQGSLKINGDKITIFSEDHSVTEVIALGKPAKFSQQSELEKPPIEGYAEKIQYRLVNDTVAMFTRASLVQGASVISGEQIDYNMATAQVKAAGNVTADDEGNPKAGEENNGRVNMVLEPTHKKEPNIDTNTNNTRLVNPPVQDSASESLQKNAGSQQQAVMVSESAPTLTQITEPEATPQAQLNPEQTSALEKASDSATNNSNLPPETQIKDADGNAVSQ